MSRTPSPTSSLPAHRSATVGLVQISLAGALWGTGGIAVQLVREHASLSAAVISGYRTVLGAAALLVLLIGSRLGGAALALVRRDPARVAVVALTTLAYQVLYYVAVTQAGVSVATVVTLGLAPVLVTVHEARVARRAPSPASVAVLLTALVGLVLVAGAAGDAGGPRPLLGLLSAAASATTYAVATVRGRTVARAADPVALAAVTTGIGALVMLPVLVVLGGTGSTVVTVDPTALALLGYLGVATMALAGYLVYAGLRVVTGSAATLATLLEPVTAAAVAALVLGERLGGTGWLGLVLVLAALVGLATRRTP